MTGALTSNSYDVGIFGWGRVWAVRSGGLREKTCLLVGEIKGKGEKY